ncbi:MAG: hypothetical protein ABIH76_03485 [Candidatus Bathyarchaeota archaeon]
MRRQKLNTNYTKKGGEKIMRLKALSVLLISAFSLFLLANCAEAFTPQDLAPNTQRIITDIHYDGGAIVGQSTTIYGHFIDGNGNHIYVTATQEYAVINGSVKLTNATSDSEVYAPNGELQSTSHSETEYIYDEGGHLIDATGFTDTTSYKYDEEGNIVEKTVTHTDVDYIIMGGQALVSSTHTTGTIYRLDEVEGSETNGQLVKFATIDRTETFTYTFVAGTYKQATRTVDSTTTYEEIGAHDIDGDGANDHLYDHQTYTIAYTYDEGGLLISASYTSGSGDGYMFNQSAGEYQSYTSTLDLSMSYIVVENGVITDEHLEWVQTWTDLDPPPPPADPAATGAVYQAADGTWHMQVKVWTNEQGTEWVEIDIALDLSSLDETSLAEVESVLREYAASGKDLTLYGLSSGGVLYDGAVLQVLGLGRGPFEQHPFDLI